MDVAAEYEVLRLRLLAAFAESDYTLGGLAGDVGARLGTGSAPSASTMHRLLNGPGAATTPTVLAVAAVLGVSISAPNGDAVGEAIEAYGTRAVSRMLRAAVEMRDAEGAAVLLERLAAMSPTERSAIAALLGIGLGGAPRQEAEGEAAGGGVAPS